jgi:hypothetical protein
MRQNDLQTGAPRRVGGQAGRSAYALRSHPPLGRARAEGERKMREIKSKNPLSEAVRREREEEWNS